MKATTWPIRVITIDPQLSKNKGDLMPFFVNKSLYSFVLSEV